MLGFGSIPEQNSNLQLKLYIIYSCLCVWNGTENVLRFSSIPEQNSDLQLKLARSRNQSMREIDQGLKEKSDKWAKERKSMVDEKKQLQAELDKVCEIVLLNK